MKTETQHTPGPWKIGHPRTYVTDADGVNIAKALHAEGYAKPSRKDISKTISSYEGKVYKGADIALNNARLIAAAPELLEVAQKLAILNENRPAFASIDFMIVEARKIVKSLES